MFRRCPFVRLGLSFQSFRTAHNLDNLVGDGRLAGFVVAQAQVLEELGGVVGGFLHGCHAGSVFGGQRVEHHAVEGRPKHQGHHAAHDVLLGGFVDVVVLHAGGTLGLCGLGGCHGQQLVGGEHLGEGVLELVVHHLHVVYLLGGKGCHDAVGHLGHSVEGGVVEQVVVHREVDVFAAHEELGRFLADGQHAQFAVFGQQGFVVLDAGVGLLDDVAVEGSAEGLEKHFEIADAEFLENPADIKVFLLFFNKKNRSKRDALLELLTKAKEEVGLKDFRTLDDEVLYDIKHSFDISFKQLGTLFDVSGETISRTFRQRGLNRQNSFDAFELLKRFGLRLVNIEEFVKHISN